MRQVRLRHRSGSHMGTKSLPGQRHPGGVPWVNSALWCGGSRVRNPGGTPIFWPLPFRGDRLETKKGARELCWFQTSLPLAALPLCRVIIACCFRVAALSGNAALALSPSGIAPELHRIQLSAICRGGQSGKVIDLLAWRCLPLGHPSAASGACAVEQISSSKRQCGKRQVSLKPALGLMCNSPLYMYVFNVFVVSIHAHSYGDWSPTSCTLAQ